MCMEHAVSAFHTLFTVLSTHSIISRRFHFRTLTLYRPIFQLQEGSKLAFALKEQYLNNYERYHHDRHTNGKVFSLRIRRQNV